MHWSRRGRGVKKNNTPGKRIKKQPRYHPYRSTLEKKVAGILSDKFDYEPKEVKCSYTIPHTYCPDFVHPDAQAVMIEVKGYFRLSSEASKYVHIKKDNPEKELIFIFSNPDKKAHPNCRPRKDGTVLTLREWATKEGFLFYSVNNLPTQVTSGKMTNSWIKEERKRFGYEA
jgi:hypothetical protein